MERKESMRPAPKRAYVSRKTNKPKTLLWEPQTTVVKQHSQAGKSDQAKRDTRGCTVRTQPEVPRIKSSDG